MIYAYRCPACRTNSERQVPVACRDTQFCTTCRRKLRRRLGNELASKVIQVPKNFHTTFSDVHGHPGSPQRDQFDKDVKSGKVQYAGPGSRWV